MRHRYLPTFITAVGLVLLAACQTSTPAADPAVVPVDAPSTTPTPAPMMDQQADVPTLTPVKSALEATDPATVQLGSGEPLLVEFFAFW
jgi:hypothetical protein